jgi:hypothetical protein
VKLKKGEKINLEIQEINNSQVIGIFCKIQVGEGI